MAASIEYTAPRTSAFTERWVISFFMYTARIEDEQHEASDEHRALFWIRLHGVISELPKYLEDSAIISEEDAAGTALARYAAAVRAASEAVDAIQKAVTRDQHIYAEWRRHTECHLRQAAFQVQANGRVDGVRSIKTDATLKSMAAQGQGKESVEELNAALARVLAAHDYDDLAIARLIAKQIRTPAESLHEAWKGFPR